MAYNASGGTGSTAATSHTYGVTSSLAKNGFSRSGYTFAGWSRTSGGAVAYASGASVANLSSIQGATVTLYAVWTAVTVTITLDYRGGSGSGSSTVSATYAAGLPAVSPPTRSGYTFVGYNTSADGSGTKIYNANGTAAIASSTFTTATTLYAIWQAGVYTLTLDSQSATLAGTTSVSATYGVALPAIGVPSRTGYSFGGYYTSTGGGGTQVYAKNGLPVAATSTFTSDTTLYAKWTAWLNISVASGSSTTTYTSTSRLEEDQETGRVTLTPVSGHIIQKFSLDGSTWYTIDSCSKVIGNTAVALGVTYYANENTNALLITFDGIFATSAIDLSFVTVAGTAYSGLKLNSGSFEGFAVNATQGGTATVVGTEFDELGEDDIVIVSADLAQAGYSFAYWQDDSGNILSYDQSVKFAKSEVADRVLTAVFLPTTDDNVSLETDNS